MGRGGRNRVLSLIKTRFRKTVLENGLTVLTESQPGFRSLSMGVWVKVGTRHEQVAEAGASHFLEHMLFKGTGTRSALEIARAVDRVGGEFNAFTAREHTCFHILLLNRDLNLGADILGDVLLNSLFDREELERERSVILQEIAMVEESPEELVHDLFFEQVYGRHPLGRPILGTARSIRRMKREDLLRYFRVNYRPDQLIFAVAGDISDAAVRKKLGALARAQWPGRPRGRRAASPVSEDAVPDVQPGFWWLDRPTEQVHLVWGVEGPKYSSKDRFAAYLLNVYLGGGMSSSLFQEIREKNGLAYTVYSCLTPFEDTGVFTIYAATGASQVPLCLRLIEECVEKLQHELMKEDDLQMVKDNLKGTILLSSDSVESRMTSIARNELYFGRYVAIEEVMAQIDAVRPEDVRRVARSLLGGEGRSVVALGPKPAVAWTKRLGLKFIRR